MNCKKCGSEIPDRTRICPECGTNQRQSSPVREQSQASGKEHHPFGTGIFSSDSVPEGHPFTPHSDQPPYGTQPNQPTYGIQPNQPSYGTQPDQPPYSAQPNQPSNGTQPNQPSNGTQPFPYPLAPKQPTNTEKKGCLITALVFGGLLLFFSIIFIISTFFIANKTVENQFEINTQYPDFSFPDDSYYEDYYSYGLDEAMLGIWNGDVYENPTAGLMYTLADGDVDTYDSAEMLNNNNVAAAVFAISNTETQTDLYMTFEMISTEGESDIAIYSEKNYISELIEYRETNADYNMYFYSHENDPSPMDIAGNEYLTVMFAVSSNDGIGDYYELVCARKTNDTIFSIIVSSFSEEECFATLERIKPLS